MFSASSLQSVYARPMATGIALWKTIAPNMLPKANAPLYFLIQLMELNFSGSSVARGTRTSAIRPAGIPTDLAFDSAGVSASALLWAPPPLLAFP